MPAPVQLAAGGHVPVDPPSSSAAAAPAVAPRAPGVVETSGAAGISGATRMSEDSALSGVTRPSDATVISGQRRPPTLTVPTFSDPISISCARAADHRIGNRESTDRDRPMAEIAIASGPIALGPSSCVAMARRPLTMAPVTVALLPTASSFCRVIENTSRSSSRPRRVAEAWGLKTFPSPQRRTSRSVPVV
jgi:hypothetical protein